MTDLGSRIRHWRVEAQLSREQLAIAVGVTASAVTSWETGWSVPGTQRLMAVAEACEVPMHVFWGRIPDLESTSAQ